LLEAALAFAEKWPVLPVQIYREDERWKKLPLISWNDASQSVSQIKAWWSQWPDALPGFRLRDTGLVIVDVDEPDEFPVYPVCLGPHSHVATSTPGHYQLVFAQPNPPIDGRFEWCEGIEIIGANCLAIGYDFGEWSFPYIAPRAVLHEMFWKRRDDASRKTDVPKEKAAPALRPVDVGATLDALKQIDPHDFRGRYSEWIALLMACKFEGIARDDFIEWCLGDEWYARDRKRILRIWNSFDEPQHGGALWKALAERGITVGARAGAGASQGPVFHREHLSSATQSKVPMAYRNRFAIPNRTRGMLGAFQREPTEPNVFRYAALMAEIGVTQDTAKKLFAPLAKQIQGWERAIERAFKRVVI